MNVTAQLRSKIIIAVLIGLAVVVALGALSDVRAVSASLAAFDWTQLPAVLGFTLLNYALRWLKWEFYLRRMRMGDGVSRFDSVLLFTSGMVMAVTPGKVGEVLKSYLLKRMNGTPIAASAPIVLAERLTDGLAMLLLMGFGLTLYPPARVLFVLMLLCATAGIVLVQFRPLCERMIALTARLPYGAKIEPKLATLYDNTAQLLEWRILLIATIISVVSWFGECVAFYFVLRGVGEPASWLLLLQATFIFAVTTLSGLVSFLPGGLGVSEVSSVALLVLLIPLAVGAATTATLIIRFCTLWFGVSLGAVALALVQRRLGDEPETVKAEISSQELT